MLKAIINVYSTLAKVFTLINPGRLAAIFVLALGVTLPFSQPVQSGASPNVEMQKIGTRPQTGGWSQQTSGVSNNLFSVHFANASQGWAVGTTNTILHTTDGGANWTAQTNQGTIPVSSYLGVRFIDTNTGWAGGGSVVLRTTDGGASWVSQGATQDGRFRNNLFAVSSTVAWIPTQNATSTVRFFSRFTTGVGEENFNAIASSAQYFDIYFTDVDNGWSVGTGPIVRITNGSSASPSFSFQTTCPCPTLSGIHMLDANTGWAVGNGGLILKTTNGGTNWNPQTSGTTTNLRSVHFADANQGWAVGAGGLILMSTDGGASWTPETSGVTTELRRVFFVSANTGYAVGATGTILKRTSGPANFVVTNTNDSGAGSLRQAIVDANANPGTDTISFAIGTGPQTITPASALPTITDPVVIDGKTQPGFTTTPIIELNGTGAGGGVHGLHITAGNSTVQGLVINRFGGSGILLETNGNNTIQCNYIGTNVAGTTALANSEGIQITSSNNTIGGMTAAARNLISGNAGAGIHVDGNGASGNQIQGNYIGTDINGSAALGNSDGVLITGSASNVIGGTASGAGNVISGNSIGVQIFGTGPTNNQVLGNFIGTTASGTMPLGNDSFGVMVAFSAANNAIGGTASGAGNTIAFNGDDGVFIASGVGTAILGNSIYANGGLGIDLDPNGVTANDPGDGDPGVNNLQNFPVLTSAMTGGSTNVQGTLNSTANTTFRIEFFSQATCDSSGNGEGQNFLGFTAVTTDGSGNGSFNVTLGSSVPGGQFITATATDPTNNTSEFSLCLQTVAVSLTSISVTPANPTVTLGQGRYLTATGTFSDGSTRILNTQTLAGNSGTPVGVATDATHLYWVEQSGGTLKRMPLGGGAITTLASGLSEPTFVAVSSGFVYFTEDLSPFRIGKIAVGGGAITTLVNVPPDLQWNRGAKDLAVDANFVYWTEGCCGGGRVRKVPLGGGSPITLAQSVGGGNPICVTLDADNVYFYDFAGMIRCGLLFDGSGEISSGGIYKVPKAGGSITQIVSGLTNPSNIVVQGNEIYWAEQGHCCFPGRVKKAPVDGGAVTLLTTLPTAPTTIANTLAVDPSFVYLTDSGSSAVRKVPLGGGAAVTIANGLSSPAAIAINAGFVYWSESVASGFIRKADQQGLTWSSSNISVATINAVGAAATAGTGSTTITATSDAVSGNTTLTVTNLTAIGVTPATTCVGAGNTQAFTATGTFSDSSMQTLAGDSWMSLAPIPTARRFAAVAEFNGLLYVMGGCGSSCTAGPDNQVYNPTTNTWTTKAALPNPTIQASAAAPGNGKIYVIGGSSTMNTVQEYDPVFNTWAIKTPMPSGRQLLATVALSGKIYALGGQDGSNATSIVEAYDPATDTWATKAPMPTARHSLAAAVANGKIYAFGGAPDCCGNSQVNVVEEYDPMTNTWTTRAPLPQALQGLAAAGINGKVYSLGGFVVCCVAVNPVYEYDPGSNSWVTKTSMPTPRWQTQAAVADGKIYMITGVGDGSSNVTAANEAYTPPQVIWTSSNTSAATINASGLATGIARGDTMITATSTSAAVSGNTSLHVAAVGNTNDSGAGSFRQAILSANANSGTDTIDFCIPGAAPYTINLLLALPTITDPVMIDGKTQSGFVSSPIVELNGTSAGGGVNGLHITAGNSTIRGLVINRFSLNGILIETNGSNTIQCNYIGTDHPGNTDFGNGVNGVSISNSANNTIGGTSAGAANLISGNESNGIQISGNGAMGNQVQGNKIGTNAAGTTALGNGVGILIASANNTIGGTVTEARNIISGNTAGAGVSTGGSDATGNLIQGNFIGTDINGTAALGNAVDGVFLGNGSTANTVGGTASGARNIISGNGAAGVSLGNTATGNFVHGNFIGTDVSGALMLANLGAGVSCFGSNNSIGGTTATARNVVSGNAIGISLSGSFANGNSVLGNYIGTTADGVSALGNQGDGVRIASNSSTNIIGGSSAGAANTIAFNGSVGVIVTSGTGNSIRGNSIHSNSGLGIDLAPAGVTPNDTNDTDTGANNLQNFPVITSALTSGSNTSVQASLGSTPNTIFTVDFYHSAAADPSGFGEGQVYLGSRTVITDDAGNTSFSATFTPTVTIGRFITATATENGNTSEFSLAVIVADASACGTLELLPTSDSFFNAGGNGSFQVTKAAGCSWTAVSNASWITNVSPPSGTGNATITYVVQANPSGARSGTITVGGQTFTVYQSDNPTLVTMAKATVSAYDKGALIEWQTANEADNLGFNIYREEAGRRTLITPQLIAGSALAASSPLSAGEVYAWWDPIPPGKNAAYWLEDIDLAGRKTLHGPFYANWIGGNPPVHSQAALLSRLGSEPSPPDRQKAIESTAVIPRAALSSRQDTLAAQAAVKLFIKHEGWYRVTQPELVGAGLRNDSDPKLLQLFVDGEEIPIRVTTGPGGRFDESAFIEFYGIGLDTPATDLRAYWLVTGNTAGRRIELVRGEGRPGLADSFSYTVERRDRLIYFSALLNGERENFFGAVVTSEGVDQTLDLQHIAQSENGATLAISLQGVTQQPHRVRVEFNSNAIGYLDFNGQQAGAAKFTLPRWLLREGANIVRLGAQDPSDVSLVEAIRLSYQHTFTADNEALKFVANGGAPVTINGFSTKEIRVFDVTIPERVQELLGEVSGQEDGRYAITVAPPDKGERRLLALADSQTSRPAAIRPNQPSRWREGWQAADLLILTTREFFNAIEPLRIAREKEGYKVAVVDVEDLYDEFSFGHKSVYAMKDFFAFAKAHWKIAPRFVLVVADASYDARNYLGLGDFDMVPTKLIDTGFLETASDDWLVDLNDDGIGEMAIGRLPVRNPEETSAVLAKLLRVNEVRPAPSALLVSDRNDGFDFEQTSAQLRVILQPVIHVEELRRSQFDEATAKTRLLEAINRGQNIINYVGHGSANLWRGNLLSANEARQLTNQSLPLFVIMNCLNGYFHHPVIDSLGESLIKAEHGGAFMVWASSGLTHPSQQAVLNKEFYRLWVAANANQTLTLGEAIQKAKATIGDGDIRRTWILLGDPTMKLK